MKHPITLSLLAIAIFIGGALVGAYGEKSKNTKYVIDGRWAK